MRRRRYFLAWQARNLGELYGHLVENSSDMKVLEPLLTCQKERTANRTYFSFGSDIGVELEEYYDGSVGLRVTAKRDPIVRSTIKCLTEILKDEIEDEGESWKVA